MRWLRRRARPAVIHYISIEGGVGVGKSTLLASLAQTYAGDPRVVVLPEPVSAWEEAGLLQAMYAGDLSAAVFQQVALMSLAAGLLRALTTPAVRLVVSERSPHSNAVFADVKLAGIELAAYRLTLEQLLGSLPQAMRRHVVLLEAPVAVLCERVATRGRVAEVGRVNAAYLQRLQAAERAWFDADAPDSKAAIDCTCAAEHVEAVVGARVAELLRAGRA